MEKRFTVSDLLPPILHPEHRREIMENAAPVVVSRIQEWYASKGADYFDGDNHPKGATRSGFTKDVANHWFESIRGEDGFDIYFSNPRKDAAGNTVHHHFGLLLHAYGGTIEAKKSGGALTIPIDPEARGMRAADYADKFGDLFLIESIEGDSLGILAYRDDQNDIIAAYALRRRVHIKSLQERKGVPAIPTDDELRAWAVEAIKAMYDDTLTPN